MRTIRIIAGILAVFSAVAVLVAMGLGVYSQLIDSDRLGNAMFTLGFCGAIVGMIATITFFSITESLEIDMTKPRAKPRVKLTRADKRELKAAASKIELAGRIKKLEDEHGIQRLDWA